MSQERKDIAETIKLLKEISDKSKELSKKIMSLDKSSALYNFAVSADPYFVDFNDAFIAIHTVLSVTNDLTDKELVDWRSLTPKEKTMLMKKMNLLKYPIFYSIQNKNKKMCDWKIFKGVNCSNDACKFIEDAGDSISVICMTKIMGDANFELTLYYMKTCQPNGFEKMEATIIKLSAEIEELKLQRVTECKDDTNKKNKLTPPYFYL